MSHAHEQNEPTITDSPTLSVSYKDTGKDGDTVGEKDEEVDEEISGETAEEETTGQATS